MDIYDPTNHDGLFDILGKAFYALDVLNTARQTTVPPEVADILAQFKLYAGSSSPVWAATLEGLQAGLAGWQTSQTLAYQIRQACENLVVQWANEATSRRDHSLRTALGSLVDAMLAGGYYVAPSTVSASLSWGVNVGDVMPVVSVQRGDGRAAEHALAETIAVKALADAPGSIQASGVAAQTDLLAGDWPLGSGCRATIPITDPADSLLANGDFEDADPNQPNVPDQWIAYTATPGATLALTLPELQTVTISGTPTGGGYYLLWPNAWGQIRSTALLPHNASGASVQAALRTIPGLESVTVSTTGTAPNYTHTISFDGVGGDPAPLMSVNLLTGGTSPAIAHATTREGDPAVYRGRALKFLSNGTELTDLYHAVSLDPETVYFAQIRARASPGILAGELRLELVDGIAGTVLCDAAGNANMLTIIASSIPTSSHATYWSAFRLSRSAAQPVYLRLRIASAITAGGAVYVDEISLARGTELYPGGPVAAAFNGLRPAVRGDSWTFTVANNRAGRLQEWFRRVFDMANKGLLLPTSGSSLIPDAVIA